MDIKNHKEVLVVGSGDQRNLKTWSGTSNRLVTLFEANGVKVDDYNIMSPIVGFRKQLLRILHKLIYFRTYARSPFMFSACSNSLENKIDISGIQNLLFIAENIEVRNTEVNVSIYIDAALRPLTQYGTYHDQTKKIGFGWFLRAYEKNDIKSYKRANHIFTQNEWTRQFLINEYGIDSKKIINVGFGVNLVPFNGNKDYNNNLLLIVLRKGVEKLKGLYLLIDAFRILRKRGVDVKLAVVGTDGPEEDGVTYYYNQPRSVTVELFQQCTLYTMPALSEPNGVTYLEGLANKAPIVGLNRFAFPEFAGNGEYGFICKNEDPEELASVIENALSDKTRLKEMGEKGQSYVVDRFDWNKVVATIIKEGGF